MPLGIEVDQTNPLAKISQRGAQIDRRGRLANSAFLIDDGDTAHWKLHFP